MTKHTNAELREMMERATPGPWRDSYAWVDTGPNSASIPRRGTADAALIAAMHTELPRLLAESEEFPRLLDRCRQAAVVLREAVSAPTTGPMNVEEYADLAAAELASLRAQFTASTERANRILEDAVVVVKQVNPYLGLGPVADAAERLLALAKEGV